MNAPATPTLDRINSPADLRALNLEEAKILAGELRNDLIHSVASTGGHFASNLGVVELSIALHYVFNTPDDRLVWDVGHQTYAHKILTGRRARMNTLRQTDGLSGFPKRDESEYDTFVAGHSSTSISAALGMAIAAKRAGSARRSVAIIGDGAMSAGMAFEALNNAGASDANLIVVLNDNEMSISNNVGALSNYLTRLLSGRFYNSMRKQSEKILSTLPPLYELARRAEEHMKGMVTPSTLFEEFGFNYFGPINGHDLPTLITTLNNLKQMEGPQLLHVVTKKGKGYTPAEGEPTRYHGVGKFSVEEGLTASAPGQTSYTEVFGQWLTDQAQADSRLVAITPAMSEGSGMVTFAQRYPERYFDVGIAEQHALTFAAGLACEGCKPVVAIYSTFLQRAYDQLIHDIALQKLPVLLAIDRAGLVGADGPTHAGAFDLSFLRCVPNIVIAAPSDMAECRLLLSTCYQHDGPSAVRYPRGSGPQVDIANTLDTVEIGRGVIRRQGEGIAILAFGSRVAPALVAAEAISAALNVTVADMRFVKPLDLDLLRDLASTHHTLVTVEENALAGGAGSAVAEALAAMGITLPIHPLGLPDRFVEHGDHAILMARCGIDAAGIESTLRRLLTTPLLD